MLARLLFGSEAGFDQNRIWCATVQLACERTACLQMLALHEHPARCAYFRSPPASPVTLRRARLRLVAHAPWKHLLTEALTRLNALPAPT